MKYTEEELQNWTSALSETEEIRVEHTEQMIKDAIYADTKLKNYDIEIFAQGSYANNTNVKAESDIDICIMLRNTFHPMYAPGRTDKDYHFGDTDLQFEDFKIMVKKAIENKFGSQNVIEGNKCLNIRENTYHVNADVVSCLLLRNLFYDKEINPNNYIEGIWFIAKDGKYISNYPKIHKKNGISKNNQTNGQYKKLVRIMKHIKNNMVDDGLTNGDIISSFLIECLIYRVSNEIITKYNSWTNTIHFALQYIYEEIKNNNHLEWREVSGILYLFKNRKWTSDDVIKWIEDTISYLGY